MYLSNLVLPSLAILGGIFLVIQGGLNSHLGQLLKSPLLASLAAFISSTLFALLLIVINLKHLPTSSHIERVPWYLWFTGGLFSVLGISLYYYTIPKLGISTMISLGLFGQLTVSAIAGNYGWFEMPIEPFTVKRFAGIVFMFLGILLLNQVEKNYDN